MDFLPFGRIIMAVPTWQKIFDATFSCSLRGFIALKKASRDFSQVLSLLATDAK
jgi:hypothetical protein